MPVTFFCPICRDECDGPVQLLCGHVFCGSCISVVAIACKNEDAHICHLVGSTNMPRKDEDSVKCPLCRTVVPLPVFLKDAKSAQSFHDVPLSMDAIIRRCPRHENHQATHFCETCTQRPIICEICTEVAHSGHDVRLISVSLELIMQSMKSVRKEAERNKALIPASIEATMSSMESISDSIESVCESIRQHADRCVAEIRRLEEELIEKAYQRQSQVSKSYDLQITDLETLQSHLELGLRAADSVESFPPEISGHGYLHAYSILQSACTLAGSYETMPHHEIRFLASEEIRIYKNRPIDAHYCSLGSLIVEKTSGKKQKLLEQSENIDLRGNCPLHNHFGQEGTKDGHFKRPICIQVHENSGHVYVSDFMNHRVQMFDEKLNFVGKFGKMGNGVGCFNQPWGLSFNRKGDILAVADSGNKRVQLFTALGDYISSIGSLSTLQRPQQLAFDQQDRLFVADSLAKKVQVFSIGGVLLQTIADLGQVQSFSLVSDRLMCCLSPEKDKLMFVDVENQIPARLVEIEPVAGSYAFASLRSGEILMSDSRLNQIRVFSPEGHLINKIGATGSPDIQLAGPEGICFHGGRLFVCDHRNSRILLF
eukprot:TRINITY_DN7061_c0_g1_i1.p1 TRINITY_DN7061_c0_g1~~TRINITY_DN7061_c0_g1_i1.p1  ORF type:complete len:598 (-),score=102.42 TRINITY_DN7061_c0_g1_i1:108-1901(-)